MAMPAHIDPPELEQYPLNDAALAVFSCSLEVFGFDSRAHHLLLNKDRHKPVVEARQVAMWVMRQLFKTSFPMLGLIFGKRDHTTAMSACRRIARQVELGSALGQLAETALLNAIGTRQQQAKGLAIPRVIAEPTGIEMQAGDFVSLPPGAGLEPSGARELELSAPPTLELDTESGIIGSS